jgi:hypothetical protein
MAGRQVRIMTTAPKRRWPRFSLWTLFVVVFLLALPMGYIAWTLQLIHRREAVLEEMRHNGGRVEYGYELFQFKDGQWVLPSVPAFRRSLGDEAIGGIILPDNYTDEDLSRIRSRFPEANVEFSRAES